MSNQQEQSIRTFAILDVEINDFHQHQFNQCSLTELCIYGISSKFLQNDIIKNGRQVDNPPKLPRVLNRINLMINPLRRIHDYTRTGLDNEMLENETPFNEDTADCILKFINRLEKPVCLVAHNGLDHDYRIIRHVYEKIKQTFPSAIYCVDSLEAFRLIDQEIDKYRKVNTKAMESIQQATANDETTIVSTKFENLENENMDWQLINESTPKRKISTMDSNDQAHCSSGRKSPAPCRGVSKVRRQLKFDDKHRSYRLGYLYKSVFRNAKFENRHEAETDVQLLAKLVLHYGAEFVKYAELNKQTFDQILKLGAENVVKTNKYKRRKL